MEIDSILSQRDLIAGLQFVVLDPGLVDKGSMGAFKVLNQIAIFSLDELGVMARNMLIIQNDVGVTLPSNQNFRRCQGQDVLLTISS